jgi:Catechol dioxygenase N terminus
MIIENQATVTDAVVEAVYRVEDARLREILLALVRHLHGFVREVRLTEREFQQAAGIIVAMGLKTTASHNEVVLMAGSLGLSSLVCLLNNGNTRSISALFWKRARQGVRWRRSAAKLRRRRSLTLPDQAREPRQRQADFRDADDEQEADEQCQHIRHIGAEVFADVQPCKAQCH